MRRKIAVMLIFLLLNCYINVFAEIYQTDDIGDLSYTDSEYTTATDAQAKKAENITERNNKEAEIRIEDEIINLSFPANIHAYFDPGNLSGKGQVFSDTYIIKNYGNTDLSIKIKNIDVNYWSDEYTYEFTEEKVTATPSQIKKINVDMIWENKRERETKVLNILDSEPNQYVLSLKAAKYDKDGKFIELNDSSIGSFYFTGTLNSNPNLIWKDGEITLGFDYEIVSEENEEFADEFLEDELNIKRDNMDNSFEKVENGFDDEEQETTDLEINQDENKDDDRQESNVISENETIENETIENETDKEIKEKEQEIKEENKKEIEDKKIIEDKEIIKDKEITEDKEITDNQEISDDEQKIENIEELEKEQEDERVDEISDKESDSEKVIEENEENEESKESEKDNKESGDKEKEEISVKPISKLKDEKEPSIIRNGTEGLEDSIEEK